MALVGSLMTWMDGAATAGPAAVVRHAMHAASLSLTYLDA
jgi:hypothetical protein